MDENPQYTKNKMIDTSKKSLFRKSGPTRIFLGVTTCTSVCFLYSLAHSKYRNFPFSFVKNWLKGSLCFSILFYSGNELMYAASNFFGIYTNFWINYSILSYYLSKIHYRYLIRNNHLKWYLAIKYSHKCFLYLLVINCLFDLILLLNKEVILYDQEDLFDIVRERFIDKETGMPNYDMNYQDLENHFMKSIQLFNSPEKLNILKRNEKRHSFTDKYTNKNSISENKSNLSTRGNKNSILFSGLSIKTVDIFELYKNNKF